MKAAEFPEREAERLEFLQALNVLDTPIDERFERLTRIVCRTLNVPISAVSLIDDARQWFKSAQGLDVSETPREVAFCAHAILDDAPFVVSDAEHDERFHDNPLVTGEPGVRAYAGIPLTFGDGVRVGTLCAIDRQPREFTAEQLESLSDLAEIVKTELLALKLSEEHIRLIRELSQAERASMLDPLTQLWNRRGGELLLNREWESAKRSGRPVCIVTLDIDHFKQINDRFGHGAGDSVLRSLSRFLLQHLRPIDAVVRWGGEEFLIVLPEVDAKGAEQVLERIYSHLRQHNFGVGQVTVSCGAATGVPRSGELPVSAIEASDQRLYQAKRNGRDQFLIGDLVPAPDADGWIRQ